MFAIIGMAIVLGSIVFGYTMHGGKIAALMQYSEFIIIGGAALGSVVIGFGFKGATTVIKASMSLLKGNPFTKSAYLDLLRAMYDIFMLSRREGPLALEKHVENPQESDIFKEYPSFLKNHHAVDLCADTLKLIIMGGIGIYDLSEMMDIDLESQHEESMRASNILGTVADSMPGFGIVAAVLGVVITMQAIGGPPEQIGEKVAAALVGTFLGVLLAYGVFSPLAKASESIAKAESLYLGCIKHAIIAFARGDAPLTCVEFARRNIEPEDRPGFDEVEKACRSHGGAKAGADEAKEAA
ncbi:MAG: flagellar motor stator protein MotA [Armatimonadota bacterium]